MFESGVEGSLALSFNFAQNHVMYSGHHRTQLGKMVNRLMCSLGQINLLFTVEQAFNKSLKLLLPHKRKGSEIAKSLR